jgi:hypothetical protein
VEIVACPLGGECGFSTICHPCGFRMRRGELRSAMLSQFENLMIFLFENIKVDHAVFFVQKANGE